MRPYRSTRAALGFVIALTFAVAFAGTAEADPPPAKGECVQVSHEARYKGYGYDHVVILDNSCERAQRCEVHTDVNPNVVEATVPPKGHRELVTFRGSPAREFTPKVSCKPEA